MNRVESDRKAILLNHLSFVQHPSQEKCPFRDRCMDSVIDTVLATKAHRYIVHTCKFTLYRYLRYY